jgi:pimeloyl-ACP methyl ester carboxylesterase
MMGRSVGGSSSIKDRLMPQKSLLRLAFLLPVFAGAGGCGGLRHEVRSPGPLPPVETHGVVFVADGAGGFHGTSDALRRVLAEEGVPLAVEAVDWSHGYGRIVADQTDVCHTRAEGLRLAGRIAAYRQACPHGAVYLVGHSAGSAVVLAAAELLPAGTVDRVVLMAASVSEDYDLRPALIAARDGIDNFASDHDDFYLGLGIAVFGTADRRWTAAAGRVGFRPVGCTPQDTALYQKLHEHPWQPCLAWTGNTGGHSGAYQPGYLRAFVLPLLRPVTLSASP